MRWKALIPTALILAALAAFTVFFLDGFVERAIESVGTKVNGAKVELDGVDVKLAGLSVTLKHLQVTDKDNPMTNALEVESLKFDVAAKPLTWKKIIIETGEINGIRTNTPRKTSGAVPRAAKEEDEEEAAESTAPSKAAEMAKEAASFAMANLKEQYDPKKLIQPENLASYKKIQEEQARIANLSAEWEKKVDGLQVSDKADRIKTFIERAKNEKFSGLEGVKKAKDYLDEAKKYRDEAKNLRQAVGDLKAALQKEFTSAKDSLKEIDTLKTQDYESFLAQLKSGAFSAEGISRGLIGPEWFAKVQKGLGLFHKVRKMIPKKKEGAKPPPPPPRTGRDIHFPFKHNWPAFHWKKAQVSGITSGEKPVQYKGTLTDVTSDPKLVGKPIALDIMGQRTDGPEKLALRAEFDYTTDTPREKLAAEYSGMKLAGTSLGKVGEPVTIGDGTGVVSVNLEARGDNIRGDIKFAADPVRLEQPITPALAANRLYGARDGRLSRTTCSFGSTSWT